MKRVLLKGGTVYDGSGAAGRAGDVLISGDRIAAVGQGLEAVGARRVDVAGLAVSPGFIDLHGHSDLAIFRVPLGNSKVAQGVTTEVVGNCGIGVFPVGSRGRFELERYLEGCEGGLPAAGIAWRDMQGFAAAVAAAQPGLNLACLTPQGALRVAAVGLDDRPATAGEMAEMMILLGESLRQGAWGMSTGLIYPPGSFAGTDELIDLARVAAGHGAVYCSHVRGEGDQLLTAVGEAVAIAAAAGVRTVVSHLKAVGRSNWGKGATALRRLQEARENGVDIWADQYPYEATATTLKVLLPVWAQEGGPEGMLARLGDDGLRGRILDAVRSEMAARGGADRIRVAALRGRANQSHVGRTLAEVAAETGSRPEESVVRLLADGGGAVDAIFFSLSREDVAGIITSDIVAVGSDGEVMAPETDGRRLVHPRAYGTFPRVLGRFVREQGLLSWQTAIYKMTGLPAAILGMSDRGLLRPGYKADIVVFDPARVIDRADFTNPHLYPAGIELVYVNGTPAVENGRLTGAGRGEVVLKNRR